MNSYNFLRGGMSHWQQTIWSLCWSGSWNLFGIFYHCTRGPVV